MKANEVQTMLGVAYEDLEILRNKGHLKASRQGNGHYDYTAESVRNCVVNMQQVRNILFTAKQASNKVQPASRPAVRPALSQSRPDGCHKRQVRPAACHSVGCH